MHLLAWAFAQQESLGLPKCARVCMKKAAPSAASWGCLSSTFSCLCENHWFADDYHYCVRQSCGVTDTYDAKTHFETHCNKLFQRDLVSNNATSPVAVTTTVPAFNSNAPNAYPVPPAESDYNAILITPGVQTVTTPGPAIPFATPSLITSSSSPIISNTSITAAPSTNTSPQASGSVSQSAKIGIGLGVPLAIILLAVIVYALYRYHRSKQKSRGSHAGNIAAAEPYPAAGNAITEKKGLVDVGAIQSRYKDDDPVSEGRELHGQHIPPYSRELEGSPGHGRKELPGQN